MTASQFYLPTSFARYRIEWPKSETEKDDDNVEHSDWWIKERESKARCVCLFVRFERTTAAVAAFVLFWFNFSWANVSCDVRFDWNAKSRIRLPIRSIALSRFLSHVQSVYRFQTIWNVVSDIIDITFVEWARTVASATKCELVFFVFLFETHARNRALLLLGIILRSFHMCKVSLSRCVEFRNLKRATTTKQLSKYAASYRMGEHAHRTRFIWISFPALPSSHLFPFGILLWREWVCECEMRVCLWVQMAYLNMFFLLL